MSSVLRARSRHASGDAAFDACSEKRKAAMSGDPTALTWSGDDQAGSIRVERRVLAPVPGRAATRLAGRRRAEEDRGAPRRGPTARLRWRGASPDGATRQRGER